MKLHRTQRTAGWIAAAPLICHSLCAQTGFRPDLVPRQDASNTITIQELRHVVPREALAEMQKATRARSKSQREQEIDHLRKAVLIDPGFIAARNNLGICLLASEPDSAIAQFEAAIKINPQKELLFSNLAVGYLLTQKLEAAERAARTSIDLDRTSERGYALLGLALYEQGKHTTEVLSHLERASDVYPITHVFAASILIERGEFRKARTHIERYLSSGDSDFREDASKMVNFMDRNDPTRQASSSQFQESLALKPAQLTAQPASRH